MKPRVRLKDWEIEAIREAVHRYDSCAEILLFGSRTDLEKRGGDIDLLVVSKSKKARRQKDRFACCVRSQR